MKVEWRLFAGAAAFAALVGGLYWVVAAEHAGAVMLLASAVAFLLVASYLAVVGRRGGVRPSDSVAAQIGVGRGDPLHAPPGRLALDAEGRVVWNQGLRD